ncbi:MAG: Fe-S protein assembly co-chaperone HscB [Reyranellaceae bacterium]
MNEVISPSGASVADHVATCWSCKGPVDRRALFCHTCSAVQPPHALDHFARLALTPRFDLDAAELERNYFRFQRIVHPDRFAAKSAREKTLSQAQAVAFNDAYETLRHPVARALHLLELKGAPLPKGEHTVKDPMLLMAALEDREALDGASNVAQIDALTAKAQQGFDKTLAALRDHFARDELKAAQAAVLRLRYLEKLLEEARIRRARLA